ncbi:hypothetical protein [Niabella hibiscisoli]|uniref:hypothetical protein n=1 Tax=Niabella hibiscisoli TaxID=1825928 RepID=UPI001F1141AC|nr:hypothetical protein [Niabella hibiscisoli]MCH5715318.1 hypothetical protein [Niabella hibiscisoli]
MKKIIILFLLVCAVKFSYAQPPAGPANAGDTYGEKVDAKGVVALSQVSKDLSKKTLSKLKFPEKYWHLAQKKAAGWR